MSPANHSCSLVDIGANLSHAAFRHDLEKVVMDAKQAGIKHIIVTGTDLQSITSGMEIVRANEGYMTLTAGFHPHVASQLDPSALVHLERWLADPLIVAAGEMGLDFNRDYSPRDVQLSAFISQLELACRVKKPVFLHQRDAHDSFYQLLREYRGRLNGGVVHCFTDERRALFDYLDLDMHIGITGWICDERRGRHLQELVSSIPADRLLLETDAPYLLPRSIVPAPAGRRNEPGFLTEVLNTVARCTGKAPEQVAAETTAAANKLFNLKLVV
ncbi:MAG: TatD family hydrolase [Pseudohongiellaceae bacterium]